MLKKGIQVPMLMLMYEYGLVSSFIELDETEILPKPSKFVIQFTDKVLDPWSLVKSDYYSLNERILMHSHTDVWPDGDKLYYKIPIPDNIVDDVTKIMESRYVLVSDEYRKMITTTTKQLPKWPENMGHFLLKYNIPLAVLKRHETLKLMSEQEIGVRIGEGIDLFRKFDFDLDIYTP